MFRFIPTACPIGRPPTPRRSGHPGRLRATLSLSIVLSLSAAPAGGRTEPPEPSPPPLSAIGPAARGATFSEEARTARTRSAEVRTDTLQWGYYTLIDGDAYAVPGETWTWDHGAEDPKEGWTARDKSTDPTALFRRIDAASWAGHGNPVQAPIIEGTASAWVGRFEDGADSLCWVEGLGYGNKSCQRLIGPELVYGGSGTVGLDFLYFNNSEPYFDYTRVLLVAGGDSLVLNPPGFNGIRGTPPHGPWARYSRTILSSELGGSGERPFRFFFEFESDGGWSDEDGDYSTDYGPFGLDSLRISGDVGGGPWTFLFESGLDGWMPETCPGVGSFFAVHPLSEYTILDPIGCRLSGNVVAFHDPEGHHPEIQDEAATSPIVDRAGTEWANQVFAEWDQYSEMPGAAGVFYRPGWSYYPYLCPNTGQTMWSPRTGVQTYYYVGDQPCCDAWRDVGTDWGVPMDCQKVRFVYEIYSSCDPYYPQTTCLATNVTPLVDNVRVRATHHPWVPALTLSPVGQFVDGFPQTVYTDIRATGVANTLRHRSSGDDATLDSLAVRGPVPTSATRWEAKLWLRVRREGPGQIHLQTYETWKARVSDGLDITGVDGLFTWAWMDSCESPTPSTSRFCSQFREDDDDFTPPEQGEGNEIVPDFVFTPGTKIEYFISGNYTCNPAEWFTLPDTTGGHSLEFEILPGCRTVEGGTYKYPCLLYVDDGGPRAGDTPYVESALNMVLAGAPDPASPIADPAPWDRFDPVDSWSVASAPLFRRAGGVSGGTLFMLLGYRTILVGSNQAGGPPLAASDWLGFHEWLQAVACGGNSTLQAFVGFGDNLAGQIQSAAPYFLSNDCGAVLQSEGYGGMEDCLELIPASGAAFPPGADLDLRRPPEIGGNLTFDLLGIIGAGNGTVCYQIPAGGPPACFAEVGNDASGTESRFPTVLGGFGLASLGPRPDPPCGSWTTSDQVTAIAAHLGAALTWAQGALPGLCVDPCLDPAAAPEEPPVPSPPVTALLSCRPNPAREAVFLRYSLGAEGPVRLEIFDANGRRIRIVAEGRLSAGPHVASWDCRDESGKTVSAGIYWAQLKAGERSTRKKMVVVGP